MDPFIDLPLEAAALNASWKPAPGDECWHVKSMSRCIVEMDHNDDTFSIRKINGKGLLASRDGLIPLAAFTPDTAE